MKKVLIIANLFHASPRIPGLVKYFPEFGWEPVILTTPIGKNPSSRFGPPDDFRNNFRVVETSGFVYEGDISSLIKERFNLTSKKSYDFFKPCLRLLHRLYRDITYYPDKEKSWRMFALREGEKILQSENIDVLMSSSSPATTHLVAKELKIKHKIPWVADLRDLWSQNHNYGYGRMRKCFDKRLELKTLRIADALVTVTPYWSEDLKLRHKKKDIYAVTNGFYPFEVEQKQVNLTPKFTITYTGQVLYGGKQDPSKIFAALRDLISTGEINPKDVEVRFYSPKDELIAREIADYNLFGVVKQYGPVSREISYEKQKESQLLLLLNWENRQGRGWHSLKIFEYFGAQRPILATGGLGDDAINELIDETKAGFYCSTVEDIKNVLKELYKEYKRKGKVPYEGQAEKINKYNYAEGAKKYTRILDSVT